MKLTAKFFIFSFLALFIACNKEPTNKVSVVESTSSTAIMRSESFDSNNGGLAVLEFNENFDSNISSVGGTFTSNFKKDGQYVHTGITTIDGNLEIPKLSDNRNLLYVKKDASYLLNKDVQISFKSANAEYADFKTSVYVPKAMKVSSTLDYDDYFDKNQDVKLSWQKDDKTESVFIAICATGIPCIFKEIPDSGNFTLDKSLFKEFPVGSKVLIHMGRGFLNKIDVNGKTVNIISGNHASAFMRTVK